MLYFSKLKITLIALFTLFMVMVSSSNFLDLDLDKQKKIKLGLDLQGGSYLLLELDNEPVIKQKLQSKLLEIKDYFKKTKKKLKDQKSQFEYSDYQKSERDFAFVIDKKIKAQDLIDIIVSIDKDLIKNVKVFDVYEGENIPKDKKSIALNVTVQSSEKTLNEKDLEKINNLIISTVESKSGAKIRS